MPFTTDKQTLEDLNIFGKTAGDAVYDSYNRCATTGGTAILEEMFRYPMSDHQAINRRTSIIGFFAQQGTAFPFLNGCFDEIEHYLSNTDQRSKLVADDLSLSQKLKNKIAPDSETAMILGGVKSFHELLKACDHFIHSLQLPRGHAYQADKEVISHILNHPPIAALLRVEGKLTHTAIAEYDVIIRFRSRDLVLKLLRQLYHLDVYFAVASVAVERGFIFAKALPKDAQVINLKGVYHPQLKAAIPNSICAGNTANLVFLTGANMAGKSTFMKSFSIAMFLAHMGFPVPAESMEFSVLDGIYTTINLPDNISIGASHFYAEVLRVKKMAQELSQGKSLFIVFDELFRGTNVKDAYEATVAISKAFALKKNSFFVISTHIIEAGKVLGDSCANIQFVYLPTLMNGNKPVYTYTLNNGITDDRHGMIIINNEGILDLLNNGLKKIQQL